MSNQLFSIFLIFLSLHFLTSKAQRCHVDDESGLLSFKSGITRDPTGILSSWKRGSNCCTWAGVTCQSGPRVTSIDLQGDRDNPNSYLSGTISSSLSRVRFLNGIYFSYLKNLSGPFPRVLFNLPRIERVYIIYSGLSGKLPENLGQLSGLNGLSLVGNRFTGKIPSSVSNLTGLSQLSLADNFFTGNIPTGISRLRSLAVIELQQNQLSGRIPNIFSSFPSLINLQLAHNKLTGNIPRTISKLSTTLYDLQLQHNFLTGELPSFLGKFRILSTLNLSQNHFSGVVPKSFVNLTVLRLDLSHNFLTDPFPILSENSIQYLDLSYNSFHFGTIPNWITSAIVITSLRLAKCGINMKLDDFNPTTTNFYNYIDLSENEITGSLVGLLNRTDYLEGFNGAGNKLKFNLGELRFVESLRELNLSRNLVFGNVPRNVSRLETLDLSYNHLRGALPVTTFDKSAFIGNNDLCGSPLPACKV